MPKINPCLWFDGQAEEAAKFYVAIFPNSKIGRINHYVEDAHGTPGKVLTVEYELDGQVYMALNGGPEFKFNEAISLMIYCADQAEVDYYWEKLTDGGHEVQCGWLRDRFGVSWQVVPVEFLDLISDPDTDKARRVTEAMYKMKKLDLAKARAAYNG